MWCGYNICGRVAILDDGVDGGGNDLEGVSVVAVECNLKRKKKRKREGNMC